jgi:hypothetical protein
MVQVLLDGGARIDAFDSEGLTALAHAEQRGNHRVAALLRKAGAKP